MISNKLLKILATCVLTLAVNNLVFGDVLLGSRSLNNIQLVDPARTRMPYNPNLTVYQQAELPKQKKIVAVEIIQVIPKAGNNPLNPIDPIKNKTLPGGQVVYQAVDDSTPPPPPPPPSNIATVTFHSTPPGATIYFERVGNNVGITPKTITVTNPVTTPNAYWYKLEYPGYVPYEGSGTNALTLKPGDNIVVNVTLQSPYFTPSRSSTNFASDLANFTLNTVSRTVSLSPGSNSGATAEVSVSKSSSTNYIVTIKTLNGWKVKKEDAYGYNWQNDTTIQFLAFNGVISSQYVRLISPGNQVIHINFSVTMSSNLLQLFDVYEVFN